MCKSGPPNRPHPSTDADPEGGDSQTEALVDAGLAAAMEEAAADPANRERVPWEQTKAKLAL